MEELIWLCWDFRGPDAARTCAHQLTHLKEWAKDSIHPVLDYKSSDHNEVWSTAYMLVNRSEMLYFRDLLKPHRGELS